MRRAAVREYILAAKASERASVARRDLPPGSSRAKVTTANARWSSAAEHRDRLWNGLTDEERAEVRRLDREARDGH